MTEEKKLTIYNKMDGRTKTRPESVALGIIKLRPEWTIIGSEAESYTEVLQAPEKKKEPEVVEVVEPEVVEAVETPTPEPEPDIDPRMALDLEYKGLYGKLPSKNWGDEAVRKRIEQKKNEA